MGAPGTGAPPRRRWVHRIPTRLRQYWKLLAVLVAVIAVLTVGFGQTMVRPYITGEVSVMRSEITDNIVGTVDLFDPAVAHTLTIDISPAEYHDMVSTFEKDGDKKWVTADIVLDGTPISDVSVRLKGNSTLMALLPEDRRPPFMRDGKGPGGPPGPGRPPGPGGPPPGEGAGKGFMAMMRASADDPTSLPLLISFDENAEGRGYQGMTELSVRPGSPVLNEALALSLTAATGQPSQRYAYATYTINGQETTRLLLEHPDETYANALFDSDGYLYKADASSQLKFVGTDQSAYADQFKQINAPDTGNLQPLINFVQWLDTAGPEEFDAQLGDWVDVDSLARYVATQNLLVNGDDMAGPGQNYYLWYDLETGKFSVISWDLNLAMTGATDIGPDDPVKMGPPPGMEGDFPPPPADGSRGGMPRGGNVLKERFLESERWSQTYHDAYRALAEQIYGQGRAHVLLDSIAATVPVTAGLSADDLSAAVTDLHDWIERRGTAVAPASGN